MSRARDGARVVAGKEKTRSTPRVFPPGFVRSRSEQRGRRLACDLPISGIDLRPQLIGGRLARALNLVGGLGLRLAGQIPDTFLHRCGSVISFLERYGSGNAPPRFAGLDLNSFPACIASPRRGKLQLPCPSGRA